ncbi:MAG: helix-turn-helix transcriptional regulator, partial [Methylocella sp.]
TRMALLEPDATIGSGYSENPATRAIFRERVWRFTNDRSSPAILWTPCFHAVGIGWTLHMQGRGWVDGGWYREIEAPLDSCWVLDAMIGNAGRTSSIVSLTRPRSARPFTADDIQRLDRLRPWLALALRPQRPDNMEFDGQTAIALAGTPSRSGEMILTADAKLVFQTPSLEFLLTILAGESANFLRPQPRRDRLPPAVLKLLRQITSAANGTSNTPPRLQVSTAYGVLTLEAKWLMPAGTLAEDAARDPKACLISVTIELREHAIAHAARILRESGATPAQTKVGIQLALGKTKPEIADKLGIQLSSVADLTRKLYQTLDIHNSAELGAKIWLGQRQDAARQNLRCAG